MSQMMAFIFFLFPLHLFANTEKHSCNISFGQMVVTDWELLGSNGKNLTGHFPLSDAFKDKTKLDQFKKVSQGSYEVGNGNKNRLKIQFQYFETPDFKIDITLPTEIQEDFCFQVDGDDYCRGSFYPPEERFVFDPNGIYLHGHREGEYSAYIDKIIEDGSQSGKIWFQINTNYKEVKKQGSQIRVMSEITLEGCGEGKISIPFDLNDLIDSSMASKRTVLKVQNPFNFSTNDLVDFSKLNEGSGCAIFFQCQK